MLEYQNIYVAKEKKKQRTNKRCDGWKIYYLS